jgi:imidazolonepropionase
VSAFELVIRNCAEVLTARGTAHERAEEALSPIAKGAVGVSQGKIAWLGPERLLAPGAIGPETEVIDAQGGFVSPGLIDPHTHLVFAGERSAEFELRCQGASYLEIARSGGGIMSTVRATRAATEDELVALARPRLRRLLDQGITYAEVKSGYGLDLPNELKQLRAVQRLGREQPVELVGTLLCAHAVPEEMKTAREQYLRLCMQEILPAVASERLAAYCDVFVEDAAFTVDEARTLLTAARELGLQPRLHVDQLTAGGGAELAAELRALTADHLENISAGGISALAGAGTTAVLVPTSTQFLRLRQYAPGRRLRDAGVNIALSTNLNPGSSMTESVSLVMALACLENGLTPAEAMWGFTRGAALALGLSEHGRLELGGPADLAVFGCESYRHLAYHLAVNHVTAVVKAGKVVARPSGLGSSLCR